jgi:RHS repeat-associated protein
MKRPIGSWNRAAARRLRHMASAGMAVVLIAGLTMAVVSSSAAAASGASPARLRPASAGKPVPVHAVSSHKVPVPAMHAWHQPAVSWPAPGKSTAVLSAPAASAGPAGVRDGKTARLSTAALAAASAGSGRAGPLPVWVGPAAASTPGGRAPDQVAVSMASRAAAAAAGVSGVIFTVSGTGDGAGASAVHVSLDYSSFAFADGGGYADRLHLVELPACVLTTPGVPACRRQQPLASANDVSDSRLGADVALPGGDVTVPAATARRVTLSAVASPAVVLGVATSTSGSAGSYSATPLSEAGTWTEGGSSGAFTYSYPVSVPPVPGGLAPQVSLGYNSQTVDGLTSSTNNQASWVGDGWDYQPGFIERGYQSCEQNPAGPTQTGDLCWSDNDVTTLSLGGASTTLVDDPVNGWHAEADNGDEITYEKGSGSNGTNDDDYWVVTAPDGDNYYFGRNELPGYASGDAATNSAWTVPVYATASTQPCYNATFASSHCLQAWRWNLDYVTDPEGDAVAYFYNTETNYYAADNGSTATASYVQGGALSKIEYGLRAGGVYGATPAAQVTFSTATSRTDVPTSSGTGDLACSSGAACDVISPTFWDRYQLTTIATSALEGSALEPVDSWSLAQDFPGTGDGSAQPPMWLESITHTTGEGGASANLYPVTFLGISLPNRVETATDLNDGYSIIDRFRIASVTSETGGVTAVTYDTPPSSCTSGNFPAPDANSALCYPDYWTPPDDNSTVEDWFNKYVVTGVTQSNKAGGTTPVVTTYSYSGAAWHYDDDSLTRSADRTWDEWRGFQSVTTQTGTSPDPVTQATDTYLQGMNGDYQGPGNATTSASLTSRVGGVTVTDSDQFAGMGFEHTVYDGAGGAIVTDTVTTPWSSAATATQSQPSPLPALTAYLTGTAETRTFTALASGGYREADQTYTHDSYGRVTVEADVPDTSDATEDTCTQTSYATNTTSWLLDLPAEVIVTAVAPASCPVSGTPTQAELVSDTQTYYDGSTTLGAAPSAGNVTTTKKATSFNGTAEVFTTQSATTYDEYGRVLTSTDADGNTTTTSYTPATGAEPTTETVTDPMGLVTTTTYDPARDLPLTTTNPAALVTTETYDALGRLTAVWTPGHATSGPADKTFSYAVPNTGPTIVTTDTINAAGTYLPSEAFYDSLGRPIETQAETPDGGRDVTDTQYDSHGWQQVTSSPYYATGAPSGTLVAANDDQVPSQTGYFYDGAGRVVRQVLYSLATEKWETDTSYGGDYTTVTPPAGGTAQTTYTNGIGKTSYIYQYHAATPPATPPAPGSGSQVGASGWDQTSYTYTPAGQQATITDDAGNQWSYGYDLAGDQVSQSDPDAGTSASSYDADGNLLSVTNANGKTTSYTYDADGRKTAEYDTTGGAAQSGSDELASWVYDTLAAGEPTSSTAYGPGGTSGTTYTESVTGYDTYGLPKGTEVSVSAGPLAGSYTQQYGYSAYGDLQAAYKDSAAGGLPAETVDTGYDTADDPISLTSSLWDYVSTLSYTELGQPLEYAFGTTTEPAWLLNSYDPATNRLTGALVQTGAKTQTGTSPVTVDDTSYSYEPSGLITAETDTPAGGPAQAQCFSYDYLGRLTTAWSQGTAGCTAGPSQSAESGAAAPYWQQYAYNNENDLTSEVSTPTSGAATTTTLGYAAAGSAQPHAVAAQQVTAPSGTTTTSYADNAAGDTTSITSPSDSQALDWNDAGQLASVTSTGGPDPGTTSYAYDASGNLLLQSDPGSVTLYLPDEQLVENTATGAVTATRFYQIGGVTVAAHTSSGDVQYLIGNQQGTATLAIDSATLAVTRRYYDPFGNQVGAAPTAWPGDKGFVGGTTDPDTGLVNLGAREYDAPANSFISPDPLLNPTDPQDLNPYAYAEDDPATMSDPSGAMPECGGDCDPSGSISAGSPDPDTIPSTPTPLINPGPSYSQYYSCNASCQATALAQANAATRPPAPRPVVHKVTQGMTATSVACNSGAVTRYDYGPTGCTVGGGPSRAGGRIPAWLTITGLVAGGVGLTILNVFQAGLDPATDGLEVVDVAAIADEAGSAADDAGAAADDAGTGAEDEPAQDDEPTNCPNQSFSADTKVLLASHKSVAIAKVKPGDKVLATDTSSGKTRPEPVTAVLVHYDTNRYDLTIKTGHGTGTLATTRSHRSGCPPSGNGLMRPPFTSAIGWQRRLARRRLPSLAAMPRRRQPTDGCGTFRYPRIMTSTWLPPVPTFSCTTVRKRSRMIFPSGGRA